MTGATAAPVAILGTGSWGTALAIHLGRQGVPARLWGRDPDFVKEIAAAGQNARYLPDVRLPASVLVTPDPKEALDASGLVVLAVPSHFVGPVVRGLGESVPAQATVVSATKGLEPQRRLRISQLLGELLPGRRVAVLSGPSFAREVAQGQPTAVVVACVDEGVARALQHRLAGPAFRIYTNRDVVGVEMAGALKNVVAIATGLSEGLRLGENARAALITRGLAEMTRLGTALGAQPATFAGLAGLGDLVLTCTGSQSRNRALGLSVARGRSLAEVEMGTRMIAEGVRTVESALALAGQARIAMPICEEVGAVLFRGRPVPEALRSLLAREPKPEDA